MRYRVAWGGWADERDTWIMCRDQCHEVQRFCWWPLLRFRSLVIGRKVYRVVYSQRFMSQWLDLLWADYLTEEETKGADTE